MRPRFSLVLCVVWIVGCTAARPEAGTPRTVSSGSEIATRVDSRPPPAPESTIGTPGQGAIRHDATGTCFPTAFGGLQLVDARTYGNNLSDASVELDDAALPLAASVYIYPAASYRTGADFDAHFAEIVSDMVSRFSATVERTEAVVDPRFPAPGRRAFATFSNQGVPWSTEAVLLRRGGFYFKARFTFRSAAEFTVRPMIDRILAESFQPCPETVPGWTRVSLEELLGPNGAPRSDAQLASIAQVIRQVEREAGTPEAHAALARLIPWIVATNDVHIVILSWMSVLTTPDASHLPELVVGTMLGMTAHLIEHRAEHPDPVAASVQLAGVASACRWYEAALRGGAAHIAALDAMVAARDRGELASWLAAHAGGTPGASAAPPSP